MKKTSNWTIAGYLAGLTFSLGRYIRYYIIYPDMDKALVYTLVGIIIMGSAFLYDRISKVGYDVDAMGVYLSDLKGGK